MGRIPAVVLSFAFLMVSCAKEKPPVVIEGTVINAPASNSLTVIRPELGETCETPSNFSISLKDDNTFISQVAVDTVSLLYVTFNDISYPILAAPGQHIMVNFDAESFPSGVDIQEANSRINGRFNDWYQYYLEKDEKLRTAIEKNRDAPDVVTNEHVLDYSRLRIQVAMEHFADTPFDLYVYSAMKDYLVDKIAFTVADTNSEASELESEKDRIVREASDLGFLTFKALNMLNDDINPFFEAWLDMHARIQGSEFEQSSADVDVVLASEIIEPISDKKTSAYLEMKFISFLYRNFERYDGKDNYKLFAEKYPAEKTYISYLNRLIKSPK